jgi:hypothetical protein
VAKETTIRWVTAPQFSPRKWEVFDVVLLAFVGFDFIFCMLAEFTAAYRVGPQPLALEVIAVEMLVPMWLLLLVIASVRLVRRIGRVQTVAFSVIAFICLGMNIVFGWIAFSIGSTFGHHLLAKNGVNQRVADECLLVAQDDLCRTGFSAYVGTWATWNADGVSNRFAQLVQSKCPTICSLKPISVSYNPEWGVDVKLSGGFNHFGYIFAAEQTNWVLSWYQEVGPR